MITKGDYLIAMVNGALTGVFSLVVLFFLDISFPFRFLVILTVPLLWILGVWLGGFLGRRIKFFTQFGKFAAVGFSSASIDFAILNFMSYATSVTAGVTVGWINIPGFLVAVVNGYLWNKLWVFKNPPLPPPLNGGMEDSHLFYKEGEGEVSFFSDFPKFFGVTMIGLLINSGIIILLTTYFPATAGDTKIWLNIAKVGANAIAMVWNFIGYKFIAFSSAND